MIPKKLSDSIYNKTVNKKKLNIIETPIINLICVIILLLSSLLIVQNDFKNYLLISIVVSSYIVGVIGGYKSIASL